MNENVKNYQEFCNEVEKLIDQFLPEGFSGHVKEVPKNNGMILSELMLSTPNPGISPALPLESFYARFQEEGIEMTDMIREVADKVMDAYIRMPDWGVDVTSLLEREKAEGRIIGEVINSHMNKDLLEQVPNVRLNEDLSLVFRISVSSHASVLIRNEHLIHLQMGLEDLMKAYRENEVNRYQLKDMAEIIPDGMMIPGMMYVGNAVDFKTGEMASYGASCIANVDFMDDVARRLGRDFAIIPSSIEEVLFVKINDMTPEQICGIIADVNATVLNETEILGDKAFMYDFDDKRIISMEEGLSRLDLGQEVEMRHDFASPEIGH